MIAHYNPMYIYIHMMRDVMLYGQIPSADLLTVGIIEALVVLLAGWIFFTRLEDKFAYHF